MRLDFIPKQWYRACLTSRRTNQVAEESGKRSIKKPPTKVPSVGLHSPGRANAVVSGGVVVGKGEQGATVDVLSTEQAAWLVQPFLETLTYEQPSHNVPFFKAGKCGENAELLSVIY